MALESFHVEFYREFNETARLLDDLASKVDSCTNETERKLKFTSEYDKISSQIDILQKYFSENTSYLPTFEVRKAQEHLAKLNKMLQEKRELLAPKKKFGFRSKQNMTSLENKIETETQAAAENASKPSSNEIEMNVESSCCIRGLKDQIIVKMGNEIDGKDVCIIDVKNSTICLQGKILNKNSIKYVTIN